MKKKSKKVRVSFKIKDQDFRLISRMAKLAGVSISVFVSVLLVLYLNKNGAIK